MPFILRPAGIAPTTKMIGTVKDVQKREYLHIVSREMQINKAVIQSSMNAFQIEDKNWHYHIIHQFFYWLYDQRKLNLYVKKTFAFLCSLQYFPGRLKF